MKTSLWIVLTVAAAGLLQAQVPPDLKTRIIIERQTPNGPELELLLSGDTRVNMAEHDDKVTPFLMKSFRSGPSNELQLIGQAPECHIDQASHRAWDTGPIVLFTPTTNVWVQGEGFLFIETNHTLDISNKVETRVHRSLLKTTALKGAKTNAPGAPEQILKIFSERAHFDYQSNFVNYFGKVHAIDVQLDLTSERLDIQMTSNSAIQTILAQDNVIMTTTNIGWATGPRSFYYVTNGSEMIEMTGGAWWHNGDEKARAEKFVYDSTHHFLTAIGNVRVWWPNAPQQPGVPPIVGTNGYRELWADFATLQWPPTNGPVEAMHATGNILIVNQEDKSSATGDQADYVRTNDLLELTGNARWWKEQMDITGKILRADATNKMYHARGDSHLKIQMTGSTHTNQWLYVDSEDLDYQTNLAVATDHVKTRLVDDGVLRDTLISDKLDVELISNEVKTAIARGHVHGETAPDKFGRIKTIDCVKLTAHRSPITKLWTDFLAETNVVLKQFGTNTAEPRDQLTAEIATAYMSPVTNQLERAVAERHVVIDQVKTNQAIHATGERAVYTVAADEVKLTGAPVARNDQYVISNSDYMIWQPKTNRFMAFGPYFVSSLKPKPTNAPPNPALAKPLAKAKPAKSLLKP
ncbi:MAG TPA: LptA/OstA family protein [Verrucomicrobiae bacterium]|jgi:lipopolysaccharide export system protein LptA|nr:LptA/OstA family protein [Verrucomicrobiae bacterium]